MSWFNRMPKHGGYQKAANREPLEVGDVVQLGYPRQRAYIVQAIERDGRVILQPFAPIPEAA